MCVCVCAPPMILCKSMGSRGVEDKEKRGLRSHLWKLVVGGGHLHILMQLGGERETDSFFFFFFSSPLSLSLQYAQWSFSLISPFFAAAAPTIISSFLFTRHIHPYFWHFCPSFPKRRKIPGRGSAGCEGGGGRHGRIYMTISSLQYGSPAAIFHRTKGGQHQRERERGQPVQHTHSKSEIIINRIGYINWKNPLRLAQHI